MATFLILLGVAASSQSASISLPAGVKSVSFGQAQRYGGAGKELCAIVQPLPSPAVFERGVTEISYAVELEPRIVKSASARVVAPAGQELRADRLQRVYADQGGLQPDAVGEQHLARRQGAAAVGSIHAPYQRRRSDGRGAVHDQMNPARRSYWISTTRSSTTAASCTKAGERRAPVIADRLRRSTRRIVVETIRKTSKWFWDDPDRHREGRLQLDAARREVVRLALRELGIEDADLAACIGDAYSHRRDIGMSAAAGRHRHGAMASRFGPPACAAHQRRRCGPAPEDCALRACRFVRRDSCRGGIGIRKAGRARLQTRAAARST